MNGILNIYKEKGFTSHDVVAKLRGVTRQKKIGHTGTLDPDAEGVLPVCLGNATKICGMITGGRKKYRAVMLLGKATDTQDISGNVISEKPVTSSREDVRGAVLHFVGGYDQIPPMYSAVKVNGRRLYELARRGVEVERGTRRIYIYDIDITDISLPEVSFTVTCSSGTYIRTLCHDIGTLLGCGACMKALLRTEVGMFHIEEALRLSDVEVYAGEGRLGDILMPVDAVFGELPAVYMRTESDRLVKNGNSFRPGDTSDGDKAAAFTGNVRVYDSQGKFVGIYKKESGYRADGPDVRFRPEKMFL